MTGLADIAAVTETVTVGKAKVEVFGVSARGIALLLVRFPDLRKMFSGVEVAPENLMVLGGDVVAAIIAAGTGSPGSLEAEALADRLPVGVQVDLLSVIIRLTMPSGFGPFVEQINALSGILNVAVPSATVRATKSPKPSKR